VIIRSLKAGITVALLWSGKVTGEHKRAADDWHTGSFGKLRADPLLSTQIVSLWHLVRDPGQLAQLARSSFLAVSVAPSARTDFGAVNEFRFGLVSAQWLAPLCCAV